MTEIYIILCKGLLAKISFRSPIIPTSCIPVTEEAERGEKGGGGAKGGGIFQTLLSFPGRGMWRWRRRGRRERGGRQHRITL